MKFLLKQRNSPGGCAILSVGGSVQPVMKHLIQFPATTSAEFLNSVEMAEPGPRWRPIHPRKVLDSFRRTIRQFTSAGESICYYDPGNFMASFHLKNVIPDMDNDVVLVVGNSNSGRYSFFIELGIVVDGAVIYVERLINKRNTNSLESSLDIYCAQAIDHLIQNGDSYQALVKRAQSGCFMKASELLNELNSRGVCTMKSSRRVALSIMDVYDKHSVPSIAQVYDAVTKDFSRYVPHDQLEHHTRLKEVLLP